MTGIVSVLTDFGTLDPYVGEMKGRMLGIDPGLRMVDLTHAVPGGDVAAGAFLLSRAFRAFPAGSVHLAVVDPGVGTRRAALAVRAHDHWFVGPDNGLLSMAAPRPEAIWRLDTRRVVGGQAVAATFHGRDLFAPAAARLAVGEEVSGFADMQPTMQALDPVVVEVDGRLVGEVLWIDRFGNAITGIRSALLDEFAGEVEIRVAGLRIREVHATFADVDPLTPLAYVGSAGTLELAVRDGDLHERFGVERGTRVEIRSARER